MLTIDGIRDVVRWIKLRVMWVGLMVRARRWIRMVCTRVVRRHTMIEQPWLPIVAYTVRFMSTERYPGVNRAERSLTWVVLLVVASDATATTLLLSGADDVRLRILREAQTHVKTFLLLLRVGLLLSLIHI